MPTATLPRRKTTVGKGTIYCPLCTHTVEAMVTSGPKEDMATPGQRCPRCSSSLDAGYVIQLNRAA